MKIALLIIDMQKVFLSNRKEINGIEKACEYINYVADLLRSRTQLIIHVKDVEGESERDKSLSEFIPEIKVKEGDMEISKLKSNSFWNTDLENILLKNKAELVIVSGFAAENCVLFTYNGAVERNFKTVILQNGIIGENSTSILETYRDRNIISYPAIEFLMNNISTVDSGLST